jgi:hypothetical protein
MMEMKWGPLSGETTVTPSTVLDNRATGSTTFLFDVVNTAGNLNLEIIAAFGNFTALGAGASGRFVARRKDGSNYCDNNSEAANIDFPTGSNLTPRVCAQLRIPNAGTWGIYFISNLGTNTPLSGNSLKYSTYNEAAE